MAGRDPNSPTSKQQTTARARELLALELRIGGATFAKIGEALGITDEGARSAVKRALERTAKETEDAAEQLRELERQRLESLILAAMPQAKRGHIGAIETIRKLSESLRKLQGLDKEHEQPRNVNLHVPEGFQESMERIYGKHRTSTPSE